MQYETITMPDAGIGSFLTSNIDEIDDNILMFGNAGGINSMKEVADRMAKMGREGDTFVVHASEKEVMVPREVAENNPQLVAQIKDAIAAEGADPEAYVVGSASNSINPMTGQREFFLKKLVKGVKKVFKKAAKIILPVAAVTLTGGLAGPGLFGLGAAGTAAVASGVGSLIQGESFKDALKSAAIAGLGTGLVGGISSGISAVASGTGTFGSGFAEGAIGTLPGSLRTGAENLFGVGQAAPAPVAPTLETLTPAQLTYANQLKQAGSVLEGPALAKAAFDAVPPVAKTNLLSTAVKYGLPTLLAAGAAGAFDEIPAEEIDLSDMNVDLADTAEDRLADDPDKYSVGTPDSTNYVTPVQAIYSGQPITTASYQPALGTYNPIVPSTTYANMVPTGAGTVDMMGTMVPSSGGVSTYVPPAPVEVPDFQPPIYAFDQRGNPIFTPMYDVPIIPSMQQEPVAAASGGAMNFPRRTGQIEGPGTETSDDIPAMLSDGEFVMTAKAVKGAGNGSREKGFRKMYDIMRSFEGGAVA